MESQVVWVGEHKVETGKRVTLRIDWAKSDTGATVKKIITRGSDLSVLLDIDGVAESQFIHEFHLKNWLRARH